MNNISIITYNGGFDLVHNSNSFHFRTPTDWGPPGVCCQELLKSLEPNDVFGKEVCELGGGYYAILGAACLLLGATQVVSIEPYIKAANHANMCMDGDIISVVGDSFDAIGNMKFDFIIGNLPQMPSFSMGLNERDALYTFGGTTGFEILQQYIETAHGHLNKGGVLRLAIAEFFKISKDPVYSYTVDIHPHNPLRLDINYRRYFDSLYPMMKGKRRYTYNVYDYTYGEFKSSV